MSVVIYKALLPLRKRPVAAWLTCRRSLRPGAAPLAAVRMVLLGVCIAWVAACGLGVETSSVPDGADPTRSSLPVPASADAGSTSASDASDSAAGAESEPSADAGDSAARGQVLSPVTFPEASVRDAEGSGESGGAA